MRNKKKIKKRSNRIKNKKKLTIVVSSFVVLMLLCSIFVYIYNKFNQINTIKIGTTNEELNISEEVKDKYKNINITNIALFGIDSREGLNGARSDTIIIGTLNKITKKIVITSILRDTYVDIPEHRLDKINHAYMYGGPELAIKTINKNFDLNIEDFITIDFYALEKVINAINGIELDIHKNELYWLNEYIKDLNRVLPDSSPKISKSGIQTLNGRQAVAYCRIRYVGAGDFQRTERQRIVLDKILYKLINNFNIKQGIDIINAVLPEIETSLTKSEIISLATSVFSMNISELEQHRLPVNEHIRDASINGIYYLIPDTLKDNIIALHKIIFDEKDYELSLGAKESNNKIQAKLKNVASYTPDTKSNDSESTKKDKNENDEDSDIIGPTISWPNPNDPIITDGQPFDPLEGVKAYDDVDGAVNVEFVEDESDFVDTQKPGEYSLVYISIDSSGNETKTTRIVIVAISSGHEQ